MSYSRQKIPKPVIKEITMPMYRPGVKAAPVFEVTLDLSDIEKRAANWRLNPPQFELLYGGPPCTSFADSGNRRNRGKSVYWAAAWAALAAQGLSPTGRKPAELTLIGFDECAAFTADDWRLLRSVPPSAPDTGDVREAVRMYLHQLRTGESMAPYFRELDVFRQNGVI